MQVAPVQRIIVPNCQDTHFLSEPAMDPFVPSCSTLAVVQSLAALEVIGFLLQLKQLLFDVCDRIFVQRGICTRW